MAHDGGIFLVPPGLGSGIGLMKGAEVKILVSAIEVSVL